MNWLQALARDLPIIPPETLLLFSLPIALVIVLLLAAALGGGESKQVARRIHRVKSGHAAAVSHQVINVRRTTSDSNIPLFDRYIKQVLPRRDELRRRLSRAGMTISLGSYLTVSLVIGMVAFGGALSSGVMPPAAAVFVGLFAMFGLPHFYTGFRSGRRQTRFIANFPEAIDLMVRGLKSGLPITESIKNAGEEVADPVGSELKRVTDSVRLGTKLEDALWEASDRLDLQEFKFFTVSLSIQSETGGNLAETLENLSKVLRGRRQLKLKIKALSSEAKASAYIIGSLPFIMAVLIYVVNTAYIMPLFLDPRGQMMVAAGFVSFLIGGFVMFRMVRFEI